MTSHERIEAALHGKPHDRVPWSPFLAYYWESQPQEIQQRGLLEFYRSIGADPLWRGAPSPLVAVYPDTVNFKTFEENGRTVQVTETPVGVLRQAYAANEQAGATLFLVEHPLKTEEDYKVQMWLEEHIQYRMDETEINKHLAGPGQEGVSLCMVMPLYNKTAFQTLVEHMAGTEELIYAMSDFPETVEALWGLMVDRHAEIMGLNAQTQHRYWISWEDSSTQNYSPAWYEKYIAPEIRQWTEILSSAGKYYIQHACGHIKGLLPAITKQNIFALESFSPPPTGNMDAADVRSTVGSGMALIGGLEPTFLLNANQAALDAEVERLLTINRGCPYVLSNSDSCPPGVELWKFKRVAEILRSAQK